MPSSPEEKPPAKPLGKPCPKKILDLVDLCTVLLSLGLLAAGVCVITPKLSIAWRLGFDHQIIVIGLLLSAMNLCLKRIAPSLFLAIEYRLLDSRLQNYDAILRNTIWLSMTSFYWRFVIIILLCLPIGLGAAYKRFTGGQSSSTIITDFPRNYSITPPPLQFYSRMNNSVYFMIDAIAPFMLAAGNDSVSPNSTDSPNSTVSLPAPYGYNVLLLDDSTAAALDMPTPDYVQSIQQNLTKNEMWTLSASVGGTVAMHNTLTNSTRNNDSYWQDIYDWSWRDVGDGGLTTFNTFDNGYDIGFVSGQPNFITGAYCFLGTYLPPVNSTSTNRVNFTTNATTAESLAFRQTALMFNVRRIQCNGVWRINSTSIELIGGNCTGDPIDQSILLPTNTTQVAPYPLDALPVLTHILDIYTGDGLKSPWLLPAYATSVAVTYWARLAFLIPFGGIGVGDETVNYPATMEKIVSTRSTLDATRPLYVVLAFQPVLTLLFFLFAMVFHSSPFSKGFGMVAVLSGIRSKNLGILGGAALSGKTKKPITLSIEVENVMDQVASPDGSSKQRIRYSVLTQPPRKREYLAKGEIYS